MRKDRTKNGRDLFMIANFNNIRDKKEGVENLFKKKYCEDINDSEDIHP
jgi:hypothetical protein